MIRIFTAFSLVLCFVCAAFAQQDTENRPTLATEITVRDNVSAQAVLIPQTDARRIFGKEIADNYAVIEVNVGNKSPDAALIIHGIFIDYSRWALSGTLNQQVATTAEDAARNRFSTFQASTRSSHVASAEYRVVRGQLLDAQVWTKRNLIVRLVTVIGNVAGASAFKFSESAAKWIAVGTGVVVPGVSTAWPDSTIEQLNRVSDLGFRTNKLIPKQSAEVIVCFFPIDRFLTPGFRKLFLKSPALFFAPLQMLVDTTMQKEVAKVLGNDLGIDKKTLGISDDETVVKTLQGHLPCYVRLVREMNYGTETSETNYVQQLNQNAAKTCLDEFGLEETTIDKKKSYQIKSGDDNKKKFARFLALDYIGQVSLNKVNVTVDGAMTIETTTLAARIEDLSFDKVNGCGDNQEECFWAFQVGGGVRTGTINGSYLTGGNVTIDEANDLGITEVKTISDGSSDQALRFSFKLTKDVPNGTTLTFKVTKPKPGFDTTIDSQPFLHQVNPPIGTPTVSGVELNDNTLTVNGSGLAAKALAVKLRSPNGNELKDLNLTTVENTKLVLEIPADQKTPGCWKVLVSAGGRDANVLGRNVNMFEVPPSPTITDADRQTDRIVVKGTGLVDTRLCGEGLTFQLVKEEATDEDTPVTAEIISWPSSSTVALELPDQVREGSWKVQALLGDEKMGDPVALQ